MADSEQRHWHLEKSVSLTHLLSTLTLFAMLVAGWVAISERIAVLESQQSSFNERIISMLENQRHTDARQDADILEIKRQIREDYREILQRLDNISRGAQ